MEADQPAYCTYPIPFDRIEPAGLLREVNSHAENARKAVSNILAQGVQADFDMTFGSLDYASADLDSAVNIAGLLDGLYSAPNIRSVYLAARKRASEINSEIYSSRHLHDVLVESASIISDLDSVQRRFIQKNIREFKMHGVLLGDAERCRLKRINLEIARWTTVFSQNAQDSLSSWELYLTDEEQLSGLPDYYVAHAQASANARGRKGWRITLQEPSLRPILRLAHDRELRRLVWLASVSRATEDPHDNRPIILSILALRQEKAGLLGYSDYAELTIEDCMARTGPAVARFLDELYSGCEAAFRREHDTLLSFAADVVGGDVPSLEAWDLAYYAEMQRQQICGVSEEDVSRYFTGQSVMDGLCAFAHKMFQLEIRENLVPTWNSSVRAFEVFGPSSRRLGAFYVDLFSRDGKRNGAWTRPLATNSISRASKHSGAIQVCAMCANVAQPSGASPGFVPHEEVEILFHEFGHVLHHTVSAVRVRSLSGACVARDFLEFPSMLFQNWCYDWKTLSGLGRHAVTGETIPEDAVRRIRECRKQRSATELVRRIGFSVVDLNLHRQGKAGCKGDAVTLARTMWKSFLPYSLPEEFASIATFRQSFGMPVGYAATVYGYLWSEMLDAEVFARFAREGLTNKFLGRELLNILSKGDSQDAMDLYIGFMGGTPTVSSLLDRVGGSFSS